MDKKYFQEKWHKWIAGLVILIILFCYVGFFIIELINDSKIKKIYDNMIYNWNSNPIKSIEIIDENKNENYELAKIKTNKNKYSFYSWRNKYFKVEKLTDYDYNNIYISEKGKLCGKDSNGNNLYFPENIGCPINKLFYSFDDFYYPYSDYTKLKLDENYFLYYSNNFIDERIVVDIKAGSSKGLQLNLEKDNDICESFLSLNKNIFKNNKEKCSSFTNFRKNVNLNNYIEIDTWKYKNFINKIELGNYDNVILYAINYLGVDSKLVGKRDNLKNYKKYMEIYKKLYIIKFIMSIISLLCSFILMYLNFVYKNIELRHLIISLIIIIIIIIHFIILTLNFIINQKYIQNVLFKINKDFENDRIKNTFNLLNIILTGLLLFVDILSVILRYIKKNNYKDQINNTNNNGNNNDSNNNDDKNNNGVNFPIKETESTNIIIKNDINFNNDSNNNMKKSKSNNEKKVYNLISKEENIHCEICILNSPDIILVPCKHNLCKDCYEQKKYKNCPFCEKTIENINKKK